ncbi:DnaD domain protein [Bacillus sp. FSL W7-1360]
MSYHWKELLPVDHFIVRLSNYETTIDQQVLTLLYQPLIGADAVGLYHGLRAQLSVGAWMSERMTHHQLALSLALDLPSLLQARKKLEGIDLLRTFHKKSTDGDTFIYVLHPPQRPNQFFSDDVLSVFLYNRLGKTQFRSLRDRFTLPTLQEDEYEEVTRAFSDVFTSLRHSEMQPKLQSDAENVLQLPEGEAFAGDEGTNLKLQGFDLALMKQSLSSFVVPDQVLTGEIETLIKKLAFVYQVTPLVMADLVGRAMHHDTLHASDLRKTVQDWYRLEHGDKPPALAEKAQPLNQRTIHGEPETEEEKVMQFYEQTPPLTLLEERQEGARVSPADARLIEELLVDYKLYPGVTNVLIDFVLYQYDMKLSRNLLLKIAAEWARHKLKTVPEAMALVKAEKQKQKQAQQKPRGKTRRHVREDKLPQWLLEKEQVALEKSSSLEEDNTLTERNEELAVLMAARKRRKQEGGQGHGVN